jgi:hypothetical protein
VSDDGKLVYVTRKFIPINGAATCPPILDVGAGLYVAARESILPPCAETEILILIEEDLK